MRAIASPVQPTPTFQLPPVVRNARGALRHAGFEFEYAGLDIEESAGLVRQIFGGDHVRRSTFVHEVCGTRYGDFAVEIDASLLKEKRYEKPLRAVGFDPDAHDTSWLEQALLGAFATLVPVEIVAPPIAITELGALEPLRRALHERGAKGTKASLFYAFGLHINVEVPDDNDVRAILDTLRAFVLLYPWARRRADVDVTRAISPFIDRFPAEYCRLILQPGYPLDRGRFVDHYLAFNATRNRALDLLPLLAWMDEPRVRAGLGDGHLGKPRPTYHYRLPNCEIDDAGWTLAREWNTWVAVERVAHDAKLLAEMSRDYLAADEASLRPFYEKWPSVLEKYLG